MLKKFFSPNGGRTSGKSSSTKSKRGKWGSKAEFFLASLGYCVGLGALTRFPYLCMKNGGGAFLIPFIICIVVAGVPLFYLEILIGQFSGRSPLTIWGLCPAFRGLGYSMTLLSAVAALYYMPFTWSSLYLILSINSDVPWRGCGNSWNTPACAIRDTANATFNETGSNNTSGVASPAEEYWNYYVLGMTPDGFSNLGSIRWPIALSHLFCWTAVYLCSMKGAATVGKVVYVTATLPYLLLVMLLARGVTLEGSLEGIKFFLMPDFVKLLDYNVWLEASIQVFYQLGPAWGGLITMASYNKFHHRCYWEAICIPVFNLLTALFGGLAIFSTLGFMAHRYGVPVGEVAKSGPGLAFVAYPEAIAQMPLSPLWAVIFFLTIIFVAIDSQFCMFETFVSGFLDLFPTLRQWKIIVSAIFAVFCFLASLILCTQGGMYIVQLLDWYSASLTFTMIGFCECIVVVYIYGLKRFYSDVTLMLGSPPNKILASAWLVVTPALMAVLTFVGMWNLTPPVYQFTNYHYPTSAIAAGWLVAMISFLPTPLMLIYVLTKTPGNFKERLKKSFQPDAKTWLPNCPELIDEYCRKWYGAPQRSHQPHHHNHHRRRGDKEAEKTAKTTVTEDMNRQIQQCFTPLMPMNEEIMIETKQLYYVSEVTKL